MRATPCLERDVAGVLPRISPNGERVLERAAVKVAPPAAEFWERGFDRENPMDKPQGEFHGNQDR
jgi:hypothetical protein